MIGAVDGLTPQGGTPTHLAIDGACAVVGQRQGQQPNENVVGLLLTDGLPEHSCGADLQSTATAAESCHDAGGGPRVYLLGVETNTSPPYTQLDDVAAAAGTGSLYLAEANDVVGNVLTQLYAIRDAALSL